MVMAMAAARFGTRDRTILRPAERRDAPDVARLIDIAGEGIPCWLWSQGASSREEAFAVGAARAAREEANFSYRNAVLADRDGEIVGMMLGYVLGEAPDDRRAALAEVPEFLRPLAELEWVVPGSFYVNALAVDAAWRSHGIGSALLDAAGRRASAAGARLLSLAAFSQNERAVALYRRLGWRVVAERPVVPHPSHAYDDRILLMTKQAG